MEATTRLMYTWELIEEANKLEDTNNMKPLILKSLGVSQKLNKGQGLFGPRVHTRTPISALMHRSNAQVMLENIDDETTQIKFRQIYENFVD